MRLSIAIPIVAMAAAACSALGVGDIAVDSCWDSRGAGCFKCPPSRDRELLNTCATGCQQFDNHKRIPGFYGHPLELPDGGVDGAPPPGGSPPDAAGLPSCASFVNPVYIAGSSALQLTWEGVGRALGSAGTVIFQAEPSCAGIESILSRTPMTGVAFAFAGGEKKECALPPEGIAADIGLSDVSHRECPGTPSELPADVADVSGPIQVFLFAVPVGSIEESISAEAAARVFGLGSSAGIKPWIHDELILRRHERSGTQIVISKFLGLDPARWAGTRVESSSAIATRIAESSDVAATIAITSPDVAEEAKNRPIMKALRYQHFDQTCGYLPDSERGAQDKRNVRAGRYALWAPVHMLTHVRGLGGDPIRPGAAAILKFLTGEAEIGGINHIAVLKHGRVVPTCAMRVTRDPRLPVSAPMEPFTPAAPCGCAFELANGGSSTCKSCNFDRDCPTSAPKCRLGGCEGF